MLTIENIQTFNKKHIYNNREVWECVYVGITNHTYQFKFLCTARKPRSKYHKGDICYVNISRERLPDEHLATAVMGKPMYIIESFNVNSSDIDGYISIDDIETEKAFTDCLTKQILI